MKKNNTGWKKRFNNKFFINDNSLTIEQIVIIEKFISQEKEKSKREGAIEVLTIANNSNDCQKSVSDQFRKLL